MNKQQVLFYADVIKSEFLSGGEVVKAAGMMRDAALAEPEPLAEGLEGRIIRQENGSYILLGIGFDADIGLEPGDGKDVRVVLYAEQKGE